jgi:hypothetical protein
MKRENTKIKQLAPLFVALFVAIAQNAVAASGKFQFVSGDVRVQTKTGEIVNVVKGTDVNEGDVIFSGSPALAQLKMDDGGTLVVRPNTRLTISTYRFNGTEDGTERATYLLDRGSVRAITGQIGKTNKQNYLIQTPTASIGVRGTDHEPAFIPKNDSGYLGTKPGTYDKVNTGETYIETKAGLVVIKPNSVGYAEDELSVPMLLPSMPDFFNKSAKKKSSGSSADSAGGGATGVSPRPILANNGINLSAVDVVVPAPNVGVATLATYIDTAPAGGLTILHKRNLAFDSNSAALAERGSSPTLGVNWGRWDTGFLIDGKAPAGNLHFVNASSLTSPTQLAAILPITATYNSIGGTRPTDELGRVGNLTSVSANVNFANQTITDYTLKASNSGRTWDASGSGSFGQFLSSNNGLRLNGLCTGCIDSFGNPVTSTANGFAKGAFVGAQAQGLITTYGLQSNEQGISGAAVLQRP